MNENEVNSFLEKLGLTEYEAKTLTALFRLKEAEAPEISRVAQVPKTRVYDVLDRLTKKNILIEIHGRPKRYMAIEAEKAFNVLIDEKKKELAGLEKEALELKDSISGGVANGQHEKVMKVKEKSDFVKILGQHIDSANETIVALAPLHKEHSMLRDSFKKAADRNVDIKIIGGINSETEKTAKDFSQAGADMRDFEHGVNAYIIDGKKVILGISDFGAENQEYHFTIWPDNRAMADAFKKFFDHAWDKGKEI